MSRICIKAQSEEIRAFYVLGQLVIWARGQKPTPCHEVRIERWPFRIYPPQYQVVACIDKGVICIQPIVPYQAAAFFRVSKEILDAMNGVAVVHHSGGAEKVKVEVIELPAKQIEQIAIKSGDGMPSPFSAAGGDVPFPFRLAKLLETGRAQDIEFLSRTEVGLHTATGYSDSFLFTEAFQNAVESLPPDTNPHPDKLINVRVVDVGGNFGGLAGLNRMYVSVASFY